MSRYATVVKFALAAGVVILVAGCGGREKVAIAAKDDTINRQGTLIAQTRADNEELQKANAALADQTKQLAEKNGAIAADSAAKIAVLNQKVDSLDATMKQMDSNIVALKPKQGLEQGQTTGWGRDADNAIRIKVAGTALFDPGKAELKSSSHATLLNVCKTIRASFPNNCIRVEGHTDSTPVVHSKAKYPDNMALSVARARAVYDFMIKAGGIPAGKMYTAGYGASQPLVHPEKTASDRAKNRRVEIVIMPDTVKVQKEQLADAKPASASTTARKK
ncbi:MAG: OmpA family protein [Planctomycetota bacterium]|nr:OmpA family protein [Planctomycetota bacterium]